MRPIKYRYFMGDFETTVYKGQTYTEVWASALVELGTEDVKIFHSLDETFEYITDLNTNMIIYYHNLKFDGAFWLSYLLTELKFEQAYEETKDENENTIITWHNNRQMKNKSFKYLISDMGQWYSVTIKYNNHLIILQDSLKLLPFSVKKIGKSFGTKHKKLDIEYEGFRYAGCEITEKEKEYIANDVFVVKEALELMHSEGHDKMTIGSCCLNEYILMTTKENFNEWFPNLYEYELNPEEYGYENVGEYIRASYRGGWCYLVKGKERKIYHNGTTADVNSLYPSVMSSESGSIYPYRNPTFWKGDYIPEKAQDGKHYYFVRIKTRFYLRPGYLPFIQIKHHPMYLGTESLETSDIYDEQTATYRTRYVWKGQIKDTRVEMVLTMTDYQLIKEHYELVDFEILDGCYFSAMIGLFDDYIYKYKKIKMESTGARRELAKLFLNNLYGKMASSTDSSFKVAYVTDEGVVEYITMTAHDKKPGYIPVGSAITSYARNFTIRAAQLNYHGADKPGFIYADTDSIHCDLKPEEIKGIKVDNKEFCCWKLESCWDEAIFTRQKTYIEHVTHNDLTPVDNPYYDIKCAGMPEKCKKLFLKSMEDITEEELLNYNEEEQDFLKVKRTLLDFDIGLCVPGKLIPKRIPGGILLTDTTYEMR